MSREKPLMPAVVALTHRAVADVREIERFLSRYGGGKPLIGIWMKSKPLWIDCVKLRQFSGCSPSFLPAYGFTACRSMFSFATWTMTKSWC